MNKALCVTLGSFGALLLAGCGSTSEPAANAVPEAPTVNSVSGKNDTDTVANMGDGLRRLTFARAIEKAELPCDGVVKAVVEPGRPGLWRATCQGGGIYLISVSPDGTFNVTGRTDG